MDPFALKWADQRANILRAFLFMRGDDGVEHGAQELAEKTHSELVALCVQAQRDRKQAIDKPWLKSVPEVWEVSGGDAADVPELWDIGTRDQRALAELQKQEDALARQKRGRSASPRRAKAGATAVPAKDDRWDADDLQPLGQGGKGTKKSKGASSSKEGDRALAL